MALMHVTIDDGSLDLYLATSERLGAIVQRLCSSDSLAADLLLCREGRLIIDFGPRVEQLTPCVQIQKRY